ATAAVGRKRAGYRLGVSRFASDGLYAFNNQYRNEVVSGRMRLRPDERTDAALSLRYGDALYHFPTDGSGDTVSHNQHQLDRGPSVGLDLGHVFSARAEGRLTAGWHRDNLQYAIDKNGPADTTTSPSAAPSGLRVPEWMRGSTYGRSRVRSLPWEGRLSERQ